MRRAALLLALGAAGVLGVGALADATQSRPETRPAPGSTTRISFAVEARRYPSGSDAGQALWIACQGTLSSRTLALTQTAGGAYQAVVQPSLGQLAQRRLIGCLEDATVDRLRGHVTAVVHQPSRSNNASVAFRPPAL